MNTIILSDYTGSELCRYQADRAASDAAAEAEYRQRLERRQIRRSRAAGAVKHAWDYGNLISCLAHGVKLTALSLASEPTTPAPLPPSDVEKRFEAGRDGERMVLHALGQKLDDNWTAICGYRARPTDGDVDILLVGPTGVFAIEVKNYNAVISCDGDDWWNYRNGRRESLVKEGQRTPSQQIRNSISVLKSYLRKSISFSGIKTIIVFCNENSRIKKVANPTVDCITHLNDWDIKSWSTKCPRPRSKYSDSAVVECVIRSHSYWAKIRKEKEEKSVVRLPRQAEPEYGSRREGAVNDSEGGVVLRMPDSLFKQHSTRNAAITSATTSAQPCVDLMYLYRSRERSEANRWIWQAGAFNHLSDKPSLLKKRWWR